MSQQNDQALKHCYLPAPIAEGKKPQDDLKYVYLSTDDDGRECKRRGTRGRSSTTMVHCSEETSATDSNRCYAGEFKEKAVTKEAAARSKCGDRHHIQERGVHATSACGPIDEEDPESEIATSVRPASKHLRSEDDDRQSPPTTYYHFQKQAQGLHVETLE